MRHDLSPARIVPIVLAAGASSRMGRPKALLDFDGRTALEIALDAVSGLGTPVVVLGTDRADIETRVDLSGVRVASNPDSASGQTASLCAGLKLLSSETESFVFMPVDHPLVRRQEIARLVGAAYALPAKEVFIPVHDGRRGHPVLCRRSLIPELLALPDATPVRVLLRAIPARVEEVPCDDRFILMGMNTPEDYASCLEAYRARSSS